MQTPYPQITVLGTGLLGGSLLAAAKARGACARAVAWSRSAATRGKTRAKPWCDAVFDTPRDAVRDADLVVLCAPVEAIPVLMADIAPALKPSATVTDVGSVKNAICKAGARVLGAAFVGSHPMAGSEKTGVDAASADLFEGCVCFVAPTADSDAARMPPLCAFWETLGARVERVAPDAHDEIVARVSHLPHAVANILCATLAKKHGDWKRFSGNGLRDTTRIAASDPELWRQIFAQNRLAISRALGDFADELSEWRDAVDRGDFDRLQQLLAGASAYRSDWPAKKS